MGTTPRRKETPSTKSPKIEIPATVNIVRPWKKFIVVSCSHGLAADPIALDAVCKWIEIHRPTRRIHLGDFIDLSAFMGGAVDGVGDPLKPDIDSGLEFLKRMNATDIMAGNHEHRCWRDLYSHNQLRAEAARATIEQIETTALKRGPGYGRNIWERLFWPYSQNRHGPGPDVRPIVGHFGWLFNQTRRFGLRQHPTRDAIMGPRFRVRRILRRYGHSESLYP